VGTRASGRTRAKRLPVWNRSNEIELERTDGLADHITANLPPRLIGGHRLEVPVEGGFVYAEVIKVTEFTSDAPIKWKLFAREIEPPQEGSIPIDQLNASPDD
jgi:hypothetical protein